LIDPIHFGLDRAEGAVSVGAATDRKPGAPRLALIGCVHSRRFNGGDIPTERGAIA
jgi:hypothetical protein